VASAPTPTASITNINHLSSYNWIEAPEPTIAVPGSPELWSPPKGAQKVAQDPGLIYSAQNAARHPESPLEPSSIKNGREPFTIKVEVIKNIAIFCRSEAEVSRFIGPHEFVGYGHEFEKAYTSDQISGSTGHHMIISYHFSDLKFVIQYETDGYVDNAPTKGEETNSDDLTSLIKILSLGPASSTASAASAKSKLMIKKEGKAVPIKSTLEVKTCNPYKAMYLEEDLPQLWVSQSRPRIPLAMIIRVTCHARHQEVEGKPSSRPKKKLAALIKEIISVVKENGGSGVVKYDIGQGDKLVVWQSDWKKLLPDDVYARLDSRKSKESISAHLNSEVNAE
jgi:hypothetical protein